MIFKKKMCAAKMQCLEMQIGNSCNLGDEVQALAARQFLPSVCGRYDRDAATVTPLDSPQGSARYKLIYNGWIDGNFTKFPPPDCVEPLFVSLHINETIRQEDALYCHLPRRVPFQSIASHAAYLKKHEPIGCRDEHTMKLLQAVGVKVYFSGCLTLTLQRPDLERTDEVLCVDVAPELLKELVPPEYERRARVVWQASDLGLDHATKMRLAQQHLDRLARARLVFTSRLHTALPCLAFGTPVVFLMSEALRQDVRFTGVLGFLHCLVSKKDSMPPLAFFDGLRNKAFPHELANSLRDRVSRFVGDCSLGLYRELRLSNDQAGTEPKVSIIAACRDRVSHLEKALPTWLAAKPAEIVLVDWGSRESDNVEQCIKRLGDPEGRVTLITVRDVQRWVLTRAYNLAARVARSPLLLKVDCDTMLHRDFFAYHNPHCRERVFFAGDWQKARDENERHTNGVFFAWRDDFFRAGAFNELITTYGYDDCCLYSRLVARTQARRLALNLDCLQHLAHNNAVRTDQKNRLDVEIELNRLISSLALWPERQVQQATTTQLELSDFEIWQHAPRRFVASFLTARELNPALREQLLLKARTNRDFARRKLYIHVLNGLGNRLRALASAFAVSQKTCRDLVVVWIPDFHCGARFEELFEPVDDVRVVDCEPQGLSDTDFFDQTRAQTESLLDETKASRHVYVVSACVLKSKHTSWASENAFLRDTLRPISAIRQRVNDFVAQHACLSASIGVHIRMGQDPKAHACEDTKDYNPAAREAVLKWRTLSHWQGFLEEMRRMCELDANASFFVCCDDASIFDNLQKALGQRRVYTCVRDVFDRCAEQVVTGLVDLLLLAKTKQLLGALRQTYSVVKQILKLHSTQKFFSLKKLEICSSLFFSKTKEPTFG